MSTRPTWVEVSLRQLAENYQIIREHIGPNRALMAIVKASAGSTTGYSEWESITDEGGRYRFFGIEPGT